MASPVGHSIWIKSVKAWPNMVGISDILEIEAHQAFNWSPVFLIAGIWTYFSLSIEPPPAAALTLCALSNVLWIMRRRKFLAMAVMVASAGFGIAQARTILVATPVLRASAYGTTVSGFVYDISFTHKARASLVVDVERITGVPVSEMPRRIRVTAPIKEGRPAIGDVVNLTADLRPLSRPAYPGGFDFARTMYFKSIGATGVAKTIEFGTPQQVKTGYIVRRAFHSLRENLGTRIRQAIKGPLGTIADALITGERAAIPKAMTESLQKSGLFHILSISGLHMTLVAGGVFFIVRAILAAIPWLALGHPIKKWAAIAAMLVGCLYMLIADGGAATERSYIMIAIAFIAILVDRPAISLHNLAFAALVVLVTKPEQAIDAGFQMSFLAVLGLCALYSWWQKHAPFRARMGDRFAARQGKRALRNVAIALLSSLVAGNFSGLAAAYHFSSYSTFGVIANALALPAIGLLVMPMALLGVLLMPLNLEAYPLFAMDKGLELVMTISEWVANWTGATLAVPQFSKITAILLALAAALMCICKTSLRWAALPIAAIAIGAFPAPSPALIHIDDKAINVAVLRGEKDYDPALAKSARFAVKSWARASGGKIIKASETGWVCTKKQCNAAVTDLNILLLLREAEADRPCFAADIVVAQYPLRRSCKGKKFTVDRFDVWKQGAHAIILADGKFQLATVDVARGQRPWVTQPRPKHLYYSQSP